MKDNLEQVHKSIVDLYVQIKTKTTGEVDSFSKEKELKEKEKLSKTSSLIILDYIKSSIDILVNLKVQETLESNKNRGTSELNLLSTNEEDSPNEYEKLLRQLEAEIRNHIKIEHQMKLHNEGLQFRIEELESENEKLKLKYKNVKEKRSSSEGKDINLESMKNEIVYLKAKLQNEDKMSLEFEKKLKILTLNHEIELRKLEEKNAEKVRSLNEKLKEFEEKIRDPEVLNSRKEEKKLLNRNNSASYIDRKEIKLFKGETKPQEFIRAKMEREIIADSNLNPASISRTQRRQNDANFLNNNQTKNSISKQINSHRARTTEKPSTYSVSSSVNINNKPSSSNIQSLFGPIGNINVTKSTNLQSISNATNANSNNNFMKNSLPIDLLSKLNQNGFKTNEINLKQFIYSKATKARSLSKISSVSSKIKSNS